MMIFEVIITFCNKVGTTKLCYFEMFTGDRTLFGDIVDNFDRLSHVVEVQIQTKQFLQLSVPRVQVVVSFDCIRKNHQRFQNDFCKFLEELRHQLCFFGIK